jgi:protease IV
MLALGAIFVLCIGLASSKANLGEDGAPTEKYESGSRTSAHKIAVVHLDGVILEGMLSSVHKQLEQAAKDEAVKGVVLRINSPGGSITASDDLHKRIIKLRDGDPDKKTPAKPLVVSMGSLAASGGYYAAVPAKTIFAERSTLTGSIGVYISLPNVKEMGDKYGFSMNTIKAGEIKDSGSMFAEMSPKEKQVWQDMIDDAYDQFLTVVNKGRPALTRQKLLERFTVKPLNIDPKVRQKAADYERYRADGGIYTAPKAKELGLIDEIGDQEAAIKAVAKLAELGDDYKAIRYEKLFSLSDLLRTSANPPRGALDVDQLRSALSPRVWYLAPGYEAAGMLAR